MVYLAEAQPEIAYCGWLDDSTTKEKESPENIEERLVHMFSAAEEEIFEDGLANSFSRSLVDFINRNGSTVLDLTTNLVLNERVNPEVASEALRWLGRMDDPWTYFERRWLLERSLFTPSPKTRDGAALGLASLDDPHSIPYIEQAIEREEIDELRADLKQVLDQLKNTDRCPLF
ncbi:HEAT repeat domain-containing protein [Acidobacteria bacterium AH-259-G07]|nr:HEAT repeat domain-containing protein [Acidobacteria bacterium AH-259-G07]